LLSVPINTKLTTPEARIQFKAKQFEMKNVQSRNSYNHSFATKMVFALFERAKNSPVCMTFRRAAETNRPFRVRHRCCKTRKLEA